MHSLAIGAHRLFIYVNPFEHADWTGKVDGTIVSGPSSVFANAGNLPTPVPEPSGNVLNSGAKHPPIVPKYDLPTLAGASSETACDAQLDNRKSIAACQTQTNNELQSLIAKVGLKSDFAIGTKPPYGTYQIAMNFAADNYATLLKSPMSPPNANDINQYINSAAEIVSSAQTLSRFIAALPDWPKAEVTRVTAHYALLAQVLQSCDDCWFRADAKAPKGVASKPDLLNTLNPSREAALQQLVAGRAKADTIASYESQYTAEQASLKAANDNFLSKLSIARFGFVAESNCSGLFSGGREKTVTVTFSAAESVGLKLVCVSRMFTSYGVAFSQSGTHNYTANSLPPTPVPAVPTPTPSPLPIPQTITTVTDNGPGKYRPIFVTLAHFSLTGRGDLQPNELENGLFGTIGVGATTSTNSQNPIDLDFLYGLSFAKYRSVVFTLGQHYGKEQQLAPGYFIGQQLTAAPTSAIPTVSLYHFRPFFSLTFGKQ
jgi:hypothetical protein